MRLVIMLLSVLVLMGCGKKNVAPQGETPQEGLMVIRQLFDQQDYETLVRERYAEICKARNEQDVEKMILWFSRKYANLGERESMKELCTMGLDAEPYIEINPTPLECETDQMAHFPIGRGNLTLYLKKDGKWGFHL